MSNSEPNNTNEGQSRAGEAGANLTAGLGWRPMHEAQSDGTVCALRFRDNLGSYELTNCFLHDDGHWYLIEPATMLQKQPSAWRPNK